MARARDDAREDLIRARHRLSKLLLRRGVHFPGVQPAWSFDVTTYGRQRDKLREELTLAKIDHSEAVDELDGEGILGSQNAFCRARQTSEGRRRTDEDLVSQTFASWNGLADWLTRIDALRQAA